MHRLCEASAQRLPPGEHHVTFSYKVGIDRGTVKIADIDTGAPSVFDDSGNPIGLHPEFNEYDLGGRALAVTLLRCVGLISAEALATRPWDAGPQTPTPEAQMIGETAFALGLWPDAPDSHELLAGWERFALPLAEAPAAGGGSLPSSGPLIDLALGEAQLSAVRRVGGVLQVRAWNPSSERTIVATVAGHDRRLGPARIETWQLS